MGARTVVHRCSIVLNDDSFTVLSIPLGAGAEAEPIDITTLSDEYKVLRPAAIIEDGEIPVKLAESVTLNTDAPYDCRILWNDGENDYTIMVGNVIVTSVTPAEIEVGGNRVQSTDITLKPVGDIDD